MKSEHAHMSGYFQATCTFSPYKIIKCKLICNKGMNKVVVVVIASNIHRIPDHMFDIPQTMFQVLTISKIELSKNGKVYSEAVKRKL